MKEWGCASQERPFIEAMSQTLQRALIYGDSSKDPEQIMGLAPRFNTKDPRKAPCAVNVIDAGAARVATSPPKFWLVGWGGPNTVHGLYPENSKAGLSKEDIGEEAAL